MKPWIPAYKTTDADATKAASTATMPMLVKIAADAPACMIFPFKKSRELTGRRCGVSIPEFFKAIFYPLRDELNERSVHADVCAHPHNAKNNYMQAFGVLRALYAHGCNG